MNGLLIYRKEDFIKNKNYVEWMKRLAIKKNMYLTLIFVEDFFCYGINNYEKYTFAINRSRNYEISLLLELKKIKVFNNSKLTLLGNNKLAGYKYAEELGCKYPKICLNWSNQCKKIISKPNYGHGGKDIYLINNINKCCDSSRFQQRYEDRLVGDLRFYIVGNKIEHAILRNSNDKIVSNYSQGGDFKIYNYNNFEKNFIYGFMKNLDIAYAGIDFLLKENGTLLFNEIEDVVGSRMLSALGINDTVEKFLEYIINQLKE